MNNLHDYCMADVPVISLGDPDFPPLPITLSTTPSKPPAPKKMKPQCSLDNRVNVAEEKASLLEQRITELENYSRRWNLRLYSMAENEDQNVHQEVIRICQSIRPEQKARLPDVIDSVHHHRPTKERCHQTSRDNSTVWCPYIPRRCLESC
ncbi:unnamed protein product [Arctogadus glacialis]